MSSLIWEFYLELHVWQKWIVRTSSSHSTSFYLYLLCRASFVYLFQGLTKIALSLILSSRGFISSPPKSDGFKNSLERRNIPKPNDLSETRPTCHGHERARLPLIFVRWPIQSRFFKRPRSPGCPLSLLDQYESNAIGRTPPAESRHNEREPFTVPRTPSASGEGNRPTKKKKKKNIADPSGGALRSRCENRRWFLDSKNSGESESSFR